MDNLLSGLLYYFFVFLKNTSVTQKKLPKAEAAMVSNLLAVLCGNRDSSPRLLAAPYTSKTRVLADRVCEAAQKR